MKLRWYDYFWIPFYVGILWVEILVKCLIGRKKGDK